MRPLMLEGVSAVIGKSQGYHGLPIRIEAESGDSTTRYLRSHWEPSPAEIAAIAAGAPIAIVLKVFVDDDGVVRHPPIIVQLGDIPNDV